jgi:hypothetical protein
MNSHIYHLPLQLELYHRLRILATIVYVLNTRKYDPLLLLFSV